jgi:hypothetical protein
MNPQEQIRKILKEDTNGNIRLRRRLSMLDYEVEYRLSATYRPDYICRLYKSGEELLDVVMETAIESMYYNYFSNIDDNSGEWGEIYWNMVEYVRNKYGDKIKEYYHINCGD